MNEIVISQHGDQLTVSSVQVAADFGKKHKNVVRSIENLIEQTSAQKSADLFIENAYPDNYGRQQKCYDLTRDGFCLLVMGFTGKDALEWKLKYIEAFNKMEQQLRQPPQMSPMEMIAGIANGCVELEKRTAQLEQRQTELEQKLEADRDAYVKAAFEFGRIGALQRSEIQKAVKVRAINLCEYAETYDKVGKRVISSIYKALQKKFGVDSYVDLQYQQYTDALIFIQCWEPTKELYDAVRKTFPKVNFDLFGMLTGV